MAEGITQQDARYALELVKRICAEVGPGAPGTPQERARAGMMQRELEAYLGAANVAVEEYTLAPGAFLGSLPLSALLTLAAALLNWFAGRIPGLPVWVTAAIAVGLSILAALIFFFEYIRYAEFIDPFFPKKKGVNVIGSLRKPGTASVKRVLILSGHHDSALENTWFRFLKYGLFVTLPTVVIGYLVLLGMGVLQLAGAAVGSAGLLQTGTLGWGLLAYPVLPAVIFALFFNMGRKNGGTVPGAADNLSACAVTAAMGRFLANNPAYIPEETEIRFITFGGEEAGLRGSRRYVARHLDELKRLDARLLNFETITYTEVGIPTGDVNGVKNAPEIVQSVVAAAQRAGAPYQVKPYPTGGGGSDAGPFSLAGLKAVTLLPFQFPQQLVAFYHQKWDRPEVLTIEPLFNVLKLALEWVKSGGA